MVVASSNGFIHPTHEWPRIMEKILFIEEYFHAYLLRQIPLMPYASSQSICAHKKLLLLLVAFRGKQTSSLADIYSIFFERIQAPGKKWADGRIYLGTKISLFFYERGISLFQGLHFLWAVVFFEPAQVVVLLSFHLHSWGQQG